MSGVSNKSKKGILRRGWTASVDDYAISGGWSLGGEALMVADASGGIFAFDGKSGDVLWSQQKVHEGSGLATSIHPSGTKFATASKDGKVLVWDVSKGNVMQTLDAGNGWVENVVWSQMDNGLPPHAPVRFECLMKTAKKYGNQMTTPVRSARSPGQVQRNWQRLVTEGCHSSKQLLESLARCWNGRVPWSPWY